MSRALIVLDSRFQRQKAADWCWSLKPGTRVEFKAPQRSDDQNSKMWAMLTEISVQLKWHGLKLTPDDWKLQFLDALRRAHGEQVRVVPNTDNSGFVNLGTSSSDLSKEEMSDLIELIYKFGAEHDVRFNDPQSADSSPAEGSDGEAHSSGQTVAATDTASQGETEEGDTGQATEAPAPSSDTEADRLKEFAKRIVAAIGEETKWCLSESGRLLFELAIESQEGVDKARSMAKYAARACDDYGAADQLAKDKAAQMIAGVAGCDAGALAS